MAIRVLWLVKGLGPGGAEHLLASAAESHDLTRFHIECAFVVPEKDHLAERLEQVGVRCHCLSQHSGDTAWPRRLRRLVVDGDWDVVHAHSPLLAAAGRLAVRSIRGNRHPALISTEHNEWNTFARPTRFVNQLTSRLDDAVIAVSDSTRRSMSMEAAARTEVLHHGVDVAAVSALSREREVVRSELGIRSDEFVIGTVANYRAQKDYSNLLRAMRTLIDRGIEARLVAVGQGPLASKVEALVQTLELGDHVVLTGHRTDATRVMASFDVFTLASFHEGLPVALMDACALGLAVVATTVGGVADVCTDGVDALLVEPREPNALASAWERLHSDPELRITLAAASAERAGSFDIGRTVERIEALYVQLANHGKMPARRPPEPPTPSDRVRVGGSSPARREFTIREATDVDRASILGLGRKALGWPDDDRVDELFAWKHDRNAFGPSFAYVAVDDDDVIGFRAFMRWQFRRDGEMLDAVRAVDTVTDPAAQGRGVFRSLTMHGLEEIGGAGVDFVFNTPNDASRPGYLKMGWRDVGSLRAAVRFTGPRGARRAASSRVPAELWSVASDIGEPFDDWFSPDSALPDAACDGRTLSTAWTHDRLRWRFGGDLLDYRVIPGAQSGTGVVVRERTRGSASELVSLLALGVDAGEADSIVGRAVRGTGVTHALRLGKASPRNGFVPMPGAGPVLMWRSLGMSASPPLANWELTMADVELF
ncbi:MAG: GNAT family N-acetyltransferase [Ilumatobacter sp.]|uniref:GNAT family N-acetyltransferase n=1 Tax=Ilumatobacter sp. TaxID=1967498 RepID=UPI003299F545